MNFTNIFFKYLVAIASFFILRKLDEKYSWSKWVVKVFKVNTMLKGFIFSMILFLAIVVLTGLLKVSLGVPDSILGFITWVTIGLIAALGSGVSNIVSKK